MGYPCSVSFVLIAYNQEAFIREACEAALNQVGDPIEIVLSDDSSTDRTFQIMREVAQSYTGSHRIILNRTEKNVGLIEHINQVVALSSGEVIVYAAGDDVSDPYRVQKTISLFDFQEKKSLLVHSCVQEINVHGGHLTIWRPPVFGKNYDCMQMAQKYSLIIGATCAWHRSIWQTFGRLCYSESYEDAIMAVRACMMNGAQALAYIDEPLVQYRISAGGVSQGGRNKPKKRLERQQFELKRLRTRSAICNQRLDDARCIGAKEMIELLEQEQKNNQTFRLVYEKKVNGWGIFLYALKNQSLSTMLAAVLKRWRCM